VDVRLVRLVELGTDADAVTPWSFESVPCRARELGFSNRLRRDHVVSSEPTAAETIVLIHGFWVTPRSWEHWVERFEGRGHRVLAPAYPGFEVDVEVEALNAHPTPIEQVTVPGIIGHLESIVNALESPPILIGHSAGGGARPPASGARPAGA